MELPELDAELRASAPRKLSEDVTTRARLREMVASTRVDAAALKLKLRHRRLIFGIPAAALGIALLTAGSLVVVRDLMPQIETIPIVYTTDTGKTISCHATIDGGGDNATTTQEIADFVKSQDWDGVGQKIYDYAIAHPWEPNPKDSWTDAAGKIHKGDPPMTAAQRDNTSWDDAMSVYIPGPIPKGILATEKGSTMVSWGWGSQDCTGVLH
jgi:hypothetical protein